MGDEKLKINHLFRSESFMGMESNEERWDVRWNWNNGIYVVRIKYSGKKI